MSSPANWTWSEAPIDGGSAVIVDVDGVIADATHRQHYLEGARRDWRGFFEACDSDPPIESLVRLVGLFEPSVAVVLLTARPHYVATKTVRWITDHGVRWDLLVVRHVDDRHVSSAAFKKRVVGELREHGFDIEVALDDDLDNIAMYVGADIPAVYIHSGYYE